jgi:mono/diheme cytochrome c family protein
VKPSRCTIAFLACLGLLILHPTARAQAQTRDTSLTTNPVFRNNCAKCHGKTAEGRHFGGPSLISDKIKTGSTDQLRNLIATGKGRMPKYAGKLTTEEIGTLAEQIKALNGK